MKSTDFEEESEQLFEYVREELVKHSRAKRAKIFHSQGLEVGEKFFAFLRKGRLVLKLPKERVSSIVGSGAGDHFDSGKGRPLAEWVSIFPSTKDEWLRLAKEAQDFVASQKNSNK